MRTAVVSDELIEAVSLLRRNTRRLVGAPWAGRPISAAQAELVRLVRREPGISVTAAAAELGLAANTVSTLVGTLVTAGLIRRSQDRADRRLARLELTDSARRRVQQWRDHRSAAVEEALRRLPAADRQAIAAAVPALARLAAELRPEET